MAEADYVPAGPAPAPDRLPVPRLTSRSGLLWSLATLVAVLAGCASVFVTQPQNRWAVLVFVPVAVLFVAFLLVRSTWVETGTGTVVHRTLLGSRRVPLAEAGRLRLVTNRGGGLLLQVRRRGSRRAVHLPVLALTDYVRRSQDPATLRALAGQVEAFAPQRTRVAEQLVRQAEHLESGGSAEDSPLAALVTHGVTTAAKGGGAAGGTSLLD
jgi:hypothetical protein